MDPFTFTDSSSKSAQGTENPSFKSEAFDKDMDASFTDENKTASEDIVHKTFNTTMPSPDPVKMRRTLPLLLIYTTVGLIYGQMGPVLPDLQKISGVDLEKASMILTGYAIGYLIGCLAGGILLEKFNPYLLLFLCTIGVAATTAILPWIPDITIMIMLRVGTGFGIGGQDTGVHAMLLNTWQNQGGRFIHVTYVLIAVGGILSPLITEPFILPEPVENVVEYSINETVAFNNDTVGISKTNTTIATIKQDPESTIHYALLIIAIVTAAAAFPSLYIYLADKIIMRKPKEADNEETRKPLPTSMKITIIGILCVNSFLSTACIDLFANFLTTFLIEQLSWAQGTGAILTSILWGTYGLGNVIAASIHGYVQTTTLIVLSYVLTIATMVTLLISVVFTQTVLIWVSVSFTGFTSAVLLPTLLTWTQENITQVTGRIASAILFSGSAGAIINPLLLGYLMDNVTPMWFLFLPIGEVLLCAVLFALAHRLFRTYSRPAKSDTLKNETDTHVTVHARDTSTCGSLQSRLDIVVHL